MEMPSDIDRMTLGLTRGSHCRTQTAGFIKKQTDIQPRVSEPEIISKTAKKTHESGISYQISH
jgi:predicted DNA binding CopG/RHH family protein